MESGRNERPAALQRDEQRDQYVLVDQEKYILEKLHPVLLREKQQKDRKLSLDEFNQLRSLVYKISWVAKESRPEASGSLSILAQHLKAPTVSDVLIANRVVKFLRSSASQCLHIWRHDPRNLRMISVSDAGGIGGPPTENGENVQNAHLIMVADDGIRQGVHSKASTLMWRSARCKRAVNETLAGETIAMSSALADAEWAQIMIQDILDQAVTVRDTTRGTLPFQVVLRSNNTLFKRLLHDHAIDAKSVFDALIKECAGSRQDRRSGLRNRQRNTQGSRLSHSLDPTSTHACRLDDEGRPVHRE